MLLQAIIEMVIARDRISARCFNGYVKEIVFVSSCKDIFIYDTSDLVQVKGII